MTLVKLSIQNRLCIFRPSSSRMESSWYETKGEWVLCYSMSPSPTSAIINFTSIQFTLWLGAPYVLRDVTLSFLVVVSMHHASCRNPLSSESDREENRAAWNAPSSRPSCTPTDHICRV
jgi:hypothetical protein